MGDDREPGNAPIAVRADDWDQYDLTDELESFLREAGTPEELKEREARLLFEFSEILRSVPRDALTDEQRFFVKETMGIMREHLTKLRSQAEWAVAMLGQKGLRFDVSARRAEPLQGFSKLRQYRFAEDVLAVYESGDPKGNSRAVRVRIAEALKNDYPPEVLSPRSFFPIWQVLDEHIDP
jgi:hypothetical protein